MEGTQWKGGGGMIWKKEGGRGDPRGRNTEKLCLIAKYFAIQKVQRSSSHQRVGMSGIRGYGKWDVLTPSPSVVRAAGPFDFVVSLYKNLASRFVFPQLKRRKRCFGNISEKYKKMLRVTLQMAAKNSLPIQVEVVMIVVSSCLRNSSLVLAARGV